MTEELNTEVAEGGEPDSAPEPEMFGAPGSTIDELAESSDEGEELPSEPTEAPDPEGEPSKPPRMIPLGEAGEFPADIEVDIRGDKVKLSDLYDGFIGQKEIQRRFTEFDKNKKQWEQEVVKRFQENEALTSTKLKKLNEHAKAGDHLGVLREMASFAGEDPVEFEQKMVTQALDLAEKFADMSEEEIRAHWAEKRAKYKDDEVKKYKTKEETEKQQKQKQAELRKVIHSYGISEQDFSQAYQALKGDEEASKVLEGLSPEQATELVCNFTLDSAKEERVVQAVEAVSPDHPEKDKLVEMLFKVAEHDYSVEDIKEIASKYLNTGKEPQAKENRSKEPASSKPAGKPETGASSAISELANQEPEDVLGWDFT